ncbi:MAG: DegT/DnrJ/EryC1/StrS aminotransferase [Deltaproteobacteria bacterium HGW-Deltaproteobacteria-15]|jgi:dTDP-4-amino-4,6-dideoxygalactose transaminase|nr:MAG: DegT/DnrJ/EryC1/StrS aminotransferase [Deltaproteobacteria bacterium HGW-Deltaproteobacteria-15]
MHEVDDFAFFGGEPAFASPLHVAQENLPPWGAIELAFKGIFDRRYFANHGPLVRELDQCFAEFIGAEHAVCVTNGTVALMILAKSMGLSGEVIVPAFTFPATIQALYWAGLTPVLCDVDAHSHMITPKTIEPHISPRTTGILAVHLWGQPCNPQKLEPFASDHGLSLFFDACHAIGASFNGRRIGNFGAGEAFSFHAGQIVNGSEGGCITTNDRELAAKLRTMRSFHPSETFARVPLRINGKMSEAQAALTLLSLKEYQQNAAANRLRYEAYLSALSEIPGVFMLKYEPGYDNNYQCIVVEIDQEQAGLHRDVFLNLLSAENVLCTGPFFSDLDHMISFSDRPPTTGSFPATLRLCNRLLQLPNSQKMTLRDVDRVCSLVRDIHQLATPIESKLRAAL